MLVESGRIELLWAPFLQLSHCEITFWVYLGGFPDATGASHKRRAYVV